MRPHGPVIEIPSPNEEAFITQDPMDIILSGNYNKVPFITGFNTREGMLFMVMADKIKNPNLYNIDFERMIPYRLKLEKGSDSSLKLANQIKEFYFGDKEACEATVDNNYVVCIII